MKKTIILFLIVTSIFGCTKIKNTDEVVDKSKQPIGVSVTIEDNTSKVFRVY